MEYLLKSLDKIKTNYDKYINTSKFLDTPPVLAINSRRVTESSTGGHDSASRTIINDINESES